MKLYYKIGVSDDLCKLFENSDTKLSEGWEIFLSLDGKKIDDWIAKHSDRIQRYGAVRLQCEDKAPKHLSNDEMRQIVYFAIQVYAFQKGLNLYLQDPNRRRLEDDIFMSMAEMGFVEEALEFTEHKFFGIFYVGD